MATWLYKKRRLPKLLSRRSFWRFEDMMRYVFEILSRSEYRRYRMKTANIKFSSIPFTGQNAGIFQDLFDVLDGVYGDEAQSYRRQSQATRKRSEGENFTASLWSATVTHH